MTDSLLSPKAVDAFTTESPIRAFTDFQVSGNVAIGKGFRPAMRHLAPYLDAMERKEGWRFAQVLLPETDASDPTILFQRVGEPRYVEPMASQHGRRRTDEDDPVNPKHYAGRECADIGERLSANGYQVLKYCWRLGKKDDPCVELGKALWYGESEFALLVTLNQGRSDIFISPRYAGTGNSAEFLEERIAAQSDFTQDIARKLWHGYNTERLREILVAIGAHRFHIDCGRGLAV